MSNTCASSLFSLFIVPVISSMRSARVDFPWSMCAMMQKFLIREIGIYGINFLSIEVGVDEKVRWLPPTSLVFSVIPLEKWVGDAR